MNNELRQALKTGVSLGLISALRIFGLMIIVPILALHTSTFQTSIWGVGVAVGIYGLFQGLGQIPFGWLSDRIGRKQTLNIGLSFFMLGSFLASFATNIYMLIFARALQGAGAINGVLSAYAMDLTVEKYRPMVLGVIGSMIGISFFLAISVAPILDLSIGINNIFLLMAALVGIAIIWLNTAVPDAPIRERQGVSNYLNYIKEKPFFISVVSVFLMHGVFTSVFMLMPRYFVAQYGSSLAIMKTYVPCMLISSLVVLMFVSQFRKFQSGCYDKILPTFVAMMLGILCICYKGSMVFGLTVFIGAFGIMESILPVYLTENVPSESRGGILGIFYMFMQLGVFTISLMVGYQSQIWPMPVIFAFLALMILFWIAYLRMLNLRVQYAQI